VEVAERNVAEHPDKARPLWDLARTRLELYFERNLSQINSIFWITLVMMFAGFVMLFWGIYQSFLTPSTIQPSIVAAVSGIMTEFIAATFLVIYKSVMAQATEYVSTLERINSVGMSIQIAESIDETNKELKDNLRAELARQILRPASRRGNLLRRSRAPKNVGRHSRQIHAEDVDTYEEGSTSTLDGSIKIHIVVSIVLTLKLITQVFICCAENSKKT
jgi:hypothetical protein